MDVSLATTTIGVGNEHGNTLKEAQAGSEPEDLVHLVRGVLGTIAAIGLESRPAVAMAASRPNLGGV